MFNNFGIISIEEDNQAHKHVVLIMRIYLVANRLTHKKPSAEKAPPLSALDTKKKWNYLTMIAPPSVQKKGAWTQMLNTQSDVWIIFVH